MKTHDLKVGDTFIYNDFENNIMSIETIISVDNKKGIVTFFYVDNYKHKNKDIFKEKIDLYQSWLANCVNKITKC